MLTDICDFLNTKQKTHILKLYYILKRTKKKNDVKFDASTLCDTGRIM